MSRLITPKEFISMSSIEIANLIENRVAFIVAEKIEFKEDIYYCTCRETLFVKSSILDDKEIKLTKIEQGIIKLLIENKGEIVLYAKLEKEIWGEKEPSIFTVRNMINKIREKTYQDFIINKSNIGYMIKG